MPKPRDYHLSEEELVVIETAIRHDKRPESATKMYSYSPASSGS